MGAKGNKTTTNTSQQQTYSANPAISGAANQAISGAQQAASSPFAMPVAPVAGFNPFQEQAFGQVQGTQGMTNPYFQQATQDINQSAQPLTDVSQYFNPMTDAVTAQLQNIFGQQNRQATTGAVQAAGGVGADRIGVAQGNLANQQTLGAGQVYSQLYQQAQAAAQADAARKQSAGYGLGQLGSAAQAASLQATSALGGAGNQQQQLQQQQLNAPYQNILAQIAYPFQTNQYLAGIAGGLAPALGGTTTGYGQSQQQAPTPSALNQILGVGTAATGLAGSSGLFGTGKGGTSGTNPQVAGATGTVGGAGSQIVPTFFADGGSVDDQGSAPPPFPYLSLPKEGGASPIPTISLPMGGGQFHNNLNLSPPQQSGKSDSGSSGLGDVAKIASAVLPFLLARGGAVNPYAMGEGYDDGGDVDFNDRFDPVYGQPLRSVDSGKSSLAITNPPLPQSNPLGGLTPGMRKDFPAIRSAAAERGVNFDIGEGYRPQNRQEELYRQGRIMPGPIVTGTRASNHTSGNAVDVLPTEGTTDKQIGDTLTDLTMHDPKFANMRSGATFSNLYDPRHIELLGNQQARTPGEPGINAGPETAEDISAKERNPYASSGPSNADMNIGNYHLAKGDQPYPDALDRDWGQKMARSPWMSLVHAGAAMASTAGPVGTAIGRGIGAGAGALEGQRKELRTEQDQNMKADHLFQQAQFHLDQYQRMTPYQHAMVEAGKGNYVNIGKDPDTGEDILMDRKTGNIIGSGHTLSSPQKGTALQSNMEYLKKRGVAQTDQEAFDIAHSGVNNSATYSRLIQAEKKYLQNQPDMAGKSDADLESKARENVEGRGFKAPGVGKKDGESEDNPIKQAPEPAKRIPGKYYIDPETGRSRKWI